MGKATQKRRATRRDGPRLLVERPLPQDGNASRAGPHRQGRLTRSVTVNLGESPLGWLHARGHLSDRQFDAGEILRRDYEIAQLGPRVTMQWNAPPPGRVARGAPEALDPTEAHIAAKRRFECALEALGPGLDDVAWRVLCAGEGLRDAEGALGWPARAGKVVLCIALDRLACHYRLPS